MYEEQKKIPKVTRSNVLNYSRQFAVQLKNLVIPQYRVNCDLFYSNINRKGLIIIWIIALVWKNDMEVL